MVAPLTAQKGASQTRPPLLNSKYYRWQKNRMMDHITGESADLENGVLDGPTIP